MNFKNLNPNILLEIRNNTNLKVELARYFSVKFDTVKRMTYCNSPRLREFGAIKILNKYGFTDDEIFCQTQEKI